MSSGESARARASLEWARTVARDLDEVIDDQTPLENASAVIHELVEEVGQLREVVDLAQHAVLDGVRHSEACLSYPAPCPCRCGLDDLVRALREVPL